MRESEGVYQFGTKRIAVRVDKDRINIRVGGGYLSIDEFLDQYTPVELEKLERANPMKRFTEKVAVQKTILNHDVRESSPVGRSPGKKWLSLFVYNLLNENTNMYKIESSIKAPNTNTRSAMLCL